MKKVSFFLLFVLVGSSFKTNATSGLQPVSLTVEYKVNPLGVDTQIPRFAWMFTSAARNQHQAAFEILVADNPEGIVQLKGNVWTSGKVNGSHNIHIEYGGQPLKSFTRYYWSVRTYDQDGQVSSWAPTAWFETAMLTPAEWKAKWIGDGSKQFERDEDFYQNDRMPLFRRELTLKKKIASARLYVAGVGYYEAYLNGKKISDHVLDPGWTTYKKEVQYVVHDITAVLKQGTNVAGIMLGNGWWNPLPLRLFSGFNLRDVQQTGRPCVKAEIHFGYTDGSSEVITTDETWLTAPGPIVRNSVYLGEHYDARLEQKNWNVLNPNKAVWENAVLTSGPMGELHVQMQPPLKLPAL